MKRPEPSGNPARGPGRRLMWMLVATSVLPLAALSLCYLFQVPLGLPGKFTYLYSPIVPDRLGETPAALLISGLIASAVWLMGAPGAARARTAALLATIGVLLLGRWVFVAPLEYLSQHHFNMSSPAHDGAFLMESRELLERGVGAYVADFPQRTRTPREIMRGTRVLSNPPATTLLAAVVRHTLDRSPGLAAWCFATLVDEPLVPPEARTAVARAIVFALLLHVLWLAAWPVWLVIGRLAGLSAAAALAAATIIVFTPSTLTFAPGKDPAQLLTAGIPLLLWLHSVRRGSWLAGGVAGAAFVAVSYVGLVHIWLGAIVLVATCIAQRGAAGVLLRRNVLPAGCGALAAIGGLALLGIDWVGTMRAVAAAQALVTRGPDAMPWMWQLLGVPLFLLFAGPGVLLALIGLPGKRAAGADGAGARGGALLEHAAPLALVVMLATVVFTNAETPRLWIPLAPLLILGAARRVGSWLERRRVALALIVLAQLAVGVAQWSLMDMREAENRLAMRDGQGARMFD